MTTREIIDEFTILINIENEYTLHEMKKILETVYKSKTEKPVKKDDAKVGKTPRKFLGMKKVVKKPKEEGEEKKKREPTEYNLYMKENYSKAKEQNPEANKSEIMKIVYGMWKAQKE